MDSFSGEVVAERAASNNSFGLAARIFFRLQEVVRDSFTDTRLSRHEAFMALAKEAQKERG